MSDSAPRLPARPSLEQLRKQAKDLLRQLRNGDVTAAERLRAVSPPAVARASSDHPTLADAQLVIAREYGFESWPKLVHHVEATNPSGLRQFETLAEELAAAYTSGDYTAVREINWEYGTAYGWDRDLTRMQERLPAWFASETRDLDIALTEARHLVARQSGFESWDDLVRSMARSPAVSRTARGIPTSAPPFYRINAGENTIEVRGPLSDQHWESVFGVMREMEITGLAAGGMTDAALERLSRLDQLTRLRIGGSGQLTDDGLRHLARLSRLQELDLSGPKNVFTDRGLAVLRYLPELRRFQMCWPQRISDAGVANLGFCHQLESVDLLGTPTGDGAIRALAGKRRLRHFKTGRLVTDAGLPLLHQFPVFKTWLGGEAKYALMSADAEPNHLLIDGPFTNVGLSAIAGLDGLFALSFFWHVSALTSDALESLARIPNLAFLGCEGKLCDDQAMRHIAALPRLRMLMAQGTVAGDDGFAALSRSRTVEYIWGRECPNLTGRGFAALAAMPALRGLAVSCKQVDDAALATLPHFPALRELMPMDVSDDGFRHVGRCAELEALWCMYCRDTGDVATGHIAGLSKLKSYYAGATRITDHSLEILGRMQSLERVSLWQTAAVTDAGIAALARLPRLREVSLEGLPRVTREGAAVFAARVRVDYSS